MSRTIRKWLAFSRRRHCSIRIWNRVGVCLRPHPRAIAICLRPSAETTVTRAKTKSTRSITRKICCGRCSLVSRATIFFRLLVHPESANGDVHRPPRYPHHYRRWNDEYLSTERWNSSPVSTVLWTCQSCDAEGEAYRSRWSRLAKGYGTPLSNDSSTIKRQSRRNGDMHVEWLRKSRKRGKLNNNIYCDAHIIQLYNRKTNLTSLNSDGTDI